MANLNTKTISAGVGDILAVDGGIDASTGRQIKDGDGTGSPFYITTTNVGIGTATPQAELHIESTDPQIRISDSNSTNTTEATAFIEMYDRNNTVILGKVGYLSPSNLDLTIHNSLAGDVNFNTSGTQKMTILAGGNVGIGCDDPGAITTQETGVILEVRGGTGTDFSGAGELRLSTADPDIIDGDVLGLISFQASKEAHGPDGVAPAAAIWCEASTAFTASSNEGDLVFSTGNTETAIAFANERMRIDNDGKVGIGTTAPGVILEIASSLSGSTQVARIKGVDLDANGEYATYQALANRSGGGSERFAELGVYNNTAVAQTAGYVAFQSHDGVSSYLWLSSTSDFIRASSC